MLQTVERENCLYDQAITPEVSRAGIKKDVPGLRVLQEISCMKKMNKSFSSLLFSEFQDLIVDPVRSPVFQVNRHFDPVFSGRT